MNEDNEQAVGDESQTTGSSNSESPAHENDEHEDNEGEGDEREDDDVSIQPLSTSSNTTYLPGGESSTPNLSQKKNNVSVNPTPRFVDNKRKNMEKNLSAGQRDQVYLKMAKDELILKKNLVDKLTAATIESNKALEKMSASIESVGKSIGEGLKHLAVAIGSNPPLAPPHHQYQNYQQNPYQPSYSQQMQNTNYPPNFGLQSPNEEPNNQYTNVAVSDYTQVGDVCNSNNFRSACQLSSFIHT